MAVVLGGSSDPEVDFFVSLHLACSQYGKLPHDGGIYDQDSYLMYGLLGAAKAFRELDAKRTHDYNQQMADMRGRVGRR